MSAACTHGWGTDAAARTVPEEANTIRIDAAGTGTVHILRF
jgi:hypothetical protein